ncbi:MAG TPA: rhombotarget lipoprotein [Steroidobacteraceae bacterium]
MKATRLFLLVFIFTTTACAGLLGGSTREGVSSSLVDYLYPEGEKPPTQSGQIPHLQLPLKIGLAFVPARSGNSQGLSEAERMKLLDDVKTTFSGRDFIEEIAVIPEAYMRTGRGFSALEQTARLYDLDVMALVSYDQVANTAEKTSSLLYWTIVGAYVVKGNKNDVQTFVDTAVFDVATRKLLFRAPGVSETKSSSTLVDVQHDVRMAQRKGFEQAMADMTVNLEKELALFKERIRTDGSVRVSRAGSSGGGGGAANPAFLILLAGLLCYPAVRHKLKS